MGMLILFRRNVNRSLFRDYLQLLISIADKRVYLTSGYFQQPNKSLKYRILDDELIRALKQTKCKDIRVGGCMGSSNKERINFINEINAQLKPKTAIAMKPKSNWHAKIALAINDLGPACAIIGSSNLTRSAFGINPNSYNKKLDILKGSRRFNHECDVVIWDNEIVKNRGVRILISKIFEESDSIFERIYFESIPKNKMIQNPSEKDLLKEIERLMTSSE